MDAQTLVCVFIARMQQCQVFSRQVPYINGIHGDSYFGQCSALGHILI